MLSFVLAALLPWLYWDQGPTTAPVVKNAGFERLYVPADQVSAWESQGFAAQAFDAAKVVKLPAPGVKYKMDVAAGTRLPWGDANGLRFTRAGRPCYYYQVPWPKPPAACGHAYA